MYPVYEYMDYSFSESPRLLVREFDTFDHATAYVTHPANSRRILTIGFRSDKVEV